MSSRKRRTSFYILCCCAFFGAYMAYATVMLLAYAEKGDGPSNRESNACGMCHGPSANNDTLDAWGGAFHDFSRDATGGGNFGGVPSGFRM